MSGKAIDQIDKNFKVETTLGEQDIVFYDVRREPFGVYGLYDYRNQPVFKRLPDDVAAATSEGVANLYLHTSGGRVRFSTDSRYVAIKSVMTPAPIKPHMAMAAVTGFDLYVDGEGGSTFYKTFMPLADMKDGYESILYFHDERPRHLTINFPLYNGVHALYVGLQEGASLGEGRQYRYEKPILYYGSSITQGGCASRPGNSYQSIISRKLDCDFINLGFSGNAKGEDTIARYMADMDVSVFVCDYDHNAPSVQHLEATHEKLFQTIRGKQRDLPVIFISKPDFDSDRQQSILRRDIIYTTYMNAIRSGDSNVYFIDGQRLFKDENRDCCTVDGCHPNDAGFLRMAEVIGHTLGRVLSGT